jgi:hypothetical protein
MDMLLQGFIVNPVCSALEWTPDFEVTVDLFHVLNRFVRCEELDASRYAAYGKIALVIDLMIIAMGQVLFCHCKFLTASRLFAFVNAYFFAVCVENVQIWLSYPLFLSSV